MKIDNVLLRHIGQAQNLLGRRTAVRQVADQLDSYADDDKKLRAQCKQLRDLSDALLLKAADEILEGME